MSEESQSQPWIGGEAVAPHAVSAKPAQTTGSANGAGSSSSTSPVVAGNSSSIASPTVAAQEEINARKAAVAKKVKGQLIRFLTTNNLEVSKAGGIKIALTFAPNSSDDYVAKFKMPDGNSYTKMEDVLVALGGSVAGAKAPAPKDPKQIQFYLAGVCALLILDPSSFVSFDCLPKPPNLHTLLEHLRRHYR